MMAALELRQSTEDVEDQPTASSVGVALQILAGGLTVTGAHAAEAAEALYPGRYVRLKGKSGTSRTKATKRQPSASTPSISRLRSPPALRSTQSPTM
jgi:hypothetical protein